MQYLPIISQVMRAFQSSQQSSGGGQSGNTNTDGGILGRMQSFKSGLEGMKLPSFLTDQQSHNDPYEEYMRTMNGYNSNRRKRF